MCGRFSLTEPKEAVEAMFGELDIADFPPRYNIAPTQPILVVAGKGAGHGAGEGSVQRHAILCRWGLWPGWMKDPRDFPLLFNARSESAIEKAAFRAAMRYRRILVPASGFYEWQRSPDGRKGKSQPYWVAPPDGGLVAFGGVMETWHAADGSEVDTAAILTTAAPVDFSAIHDRMPLVVEPGAFEQWLDCSSGLTDGIVDLLRPVGEGRFVATPVSDRVNKVANAGPDVRRPVGSPAASPRTDTPDQPTLF